MEMGYNHYVCECGCGEIVPYGCRFIHGHNARVQKNVGDRVRGISKTVEEKEQRRKTLKRKYASGEILSPNKGKEGYNKGKTWEEIYGAGKAAEMREGVKVWTKTEEAIEKQKATLKETYAKNGGLNHPLDCNCCICKVVRGECFGKDNSFYGHKHKRDSITKAFLAVQHRPTSWEKRISELIEKYKLPFTYTGDGSFWATSKGRHINPDFVDTEKKIVIEVFADFYKVVDYGSVENYLKDRSELFENIKYSVVFIHDIDLNRDNWETHCLELIRRN